MEEKNGEFTIGWQRDIEHLRHYPLDGEYETLGYLESELGSAFEALMMDLIGERVSERETQKPSEDLEVAYERYAYQYSNFISDFENSLDGRITFSEVNLHNFLLQAKSAQWINSNRTNRQLLMMQHFGIMTQVSRFVYHLYLSLVDHAQPVFRYMQEGAKILGYTDKRLFGKMHGALLQKNKLGLANAMIKGFFGGGTAQPACYYQQCLTGKIIACADYPYTFSSKYNKAVQIKPVQVSGQLKSVYDNRDCSIKLGLGEQAALFEMCGDVVDRVILSFAGTEFKPTRRGGHNIVTDVAQILFGPETTYLAAVGLLNDVKSEVNKNVLVTGHSLGGGLMKFAVAGVNDSSVEAVGFNSAGLLEYSKRTLTSARIRKAERRIWHLCAVTDFISPIGSQIGDVFYVDT